MKIPIKISEKIVVQNPYLKVLEKNFVDENGKTSSFLITGHNQEETEATFILPLTKNNTILYLKEFRYWPEEIVINFPVWMLENGFSHHENAKKELLEETGYFSDEIEFLGETIIENYFEGKISYFIAKNCEKLWNQNLEEGEKIEVFEASIEEFEGMILDGKVRSSKTAFCFLLAKMKKFL